MLTAQSAPLVTASPLRHWLRRHPLLSFFPLAYLLSWTTWLPLYYPPLAGLRLPYHHALGTFGPLLAALLLSYGTEGAAGLRGLLAGMGRWRVGLGWYAAVLLGPFALAVLALAVAALVQGQPLQLGGLGRSAELPELGWLGFLLYSVVVYGYGEEVGWRGFALPRLQQRYGARWAVLLLTIGWVIWHAPLFLYRPGYVHMDAAAALGWVMSMLTGCALLSYLYQGTRGSLLLCALFHATMDLAFTSQNISPLATNVLGALVTILGLLAFFNLRRPAVRPSLS